jgi:hypothetical protein
MFREESQAVQTDAELQAVHPAIRLVQVVQIPLLRIYPLWHLQVLPSWTMKRLESHVVQTVVELQTLHPVMAVPQLTHVDPLSA